MQDSWKQFLSQQGAVIADGQVSHFDLAPREAIAATHAAVIADLSHLGVIAAQGSEAQSFLQNQLCNDATQVTPAHCQLTGYCSPKGRLLALFRLWQRDAAYFLTVPMELLEPTIKRLRMYVLRTQVTLTDASDRFVHIGASGQASAVTLAALLGATPEAPDMALHAKGITVLRLPGISPRFELFGSVEDMQPLWETLRTVARPVGRDAWELTGILAGLPQVYKATAEEFVPQMVNLEPLNGLSYKKGCYPGQEIVARTHYLGKLKRRMYTGHVAASARPLPGDAIYAAGTEGGQSIGKVVDARPAADGGFACLAVLQTDGAETNTLHVATPDGPLLALHDLPYPPPALTRSA